MMNQIATMLSMWTLPPDVGVLVHPGTSAVIPDGAPDGEIFELVFEGSNAVVTVVFVGRSWVYVEACVEGDHEVGEDSGEARNLWEIQDRIRNAVESFRRPAMIAALSAVVPRECRRDPSLAGIRRRAEATGRMSLADYRQAVEDRTLLLKEMENLQEQINLLRMSLELRSELCVAPVPTVGPPME